MVFLVSWFCDLFQSGMQLNNSLPSLEAHKGPVLLALLTTVLVVLQ